MNFTMRNLHWTAGFIDGEGSIGLVNKSPRLSACQVGLFPLEKLVSLWGGSISPKKANIGKKPMHSWSCGSNTVGLMMTLYPLMSPYRQSQITKVLASWRSTGAQCGENHYHAKLSNEEMLTAMRRVQSGESLTAVAREIGITHSALSFCMNGIHRPELIQSLTGGHPTRRTRTYGEAHYNVTINDDEALVAMRRVKAGESMYSVARSIGLDSNTVSYWMRGMKRPYLLARLNAEPYAEEPVQGELYG